MKYTFTIVGLFLSLLACSQPSELTRNVIQFVLIKPGSFTYGTFDPPIPKQGENKLWRRQDYECAQKLAQRDGLPGFKVNIERLFYIGKFEITQKQWKEVMKSNPSSFQGDDHPVE